MKGYKIKLKWKSNEPISERYYYCEMDETFEKASPEVFEKLVTKNERLIEYAINEWGIYYLDYFHPYIRIELWRDGHLNRDWSIKRYIKNRNRKE